METPGLSMARWLREQFQESENAPEEIASYRWIWASARTRTVDIEDGPYTVEIEPTIGMILGDIRFNARFGLDNDHRIAVLFWGNGGPSPDLPTLPHLIDRLTKEGEKLLNKKLPKRHPNVKKMRPKPPEYTQDVDDGEDWKK